MRTLISTIAALPLLLPAAAWADHCYKNHCDELDYRAVGSNYESLDIDGDLRGRAIVEGFSGGGVDVSYLGDTGADDCGGYASILPDHQLTVEDEDINISFALESLGRTVLVINGPRGWLCVGDGRTDPNIELTLAEGDYRIWVAGPRDSGDDYELALRWDSADWNNDQDRWSDDDDDRPGHHDDWDDRDDHDRPLPPPPVPLTYSFIGRFEDIDVRFDGNSIAEIDSSCSAFLSRSYSGGSVDDIEISGRAFRNVYSWWDNDALCAIAALNSTPSYGDRRMANVTIEGTPISVPADPREATDLLRTYLPQILDGTMVDDVVIDGTAHRNDYSYWDTEQLITLIVSNAAPPVGRYTASGSIEDVAFAFAADDINSLTRQCVQFVNNMFPSPLIDDVVVNGTSRHNGPSYWSADEVCMIVTTLSR